ncbi:Ribosomal large subunit pseudouridine synthase A [Corynebacterium cystitidis DSM 20524]|uniref:RNA pseudouridylate synthase n=2 Tax=Corynebacterium cystitidis TaxID=35757 RepID=A0A1H9TGH7_9CORY|nr:Ribosomal large subunit pseudouridine synthase A [Corynebacterium cystitidis DSM 20524]SER95939.1 tRNA pseudouridine32 synthase / 23S rRNA pseudouridine746 synthase [Corynebacterium cystitidis DSM 20524]SNV91811.1 pseudouridylate synthase [Corynebacterium cystitidis]
MSRKKTRALGPLPPRDGLGASRVRVPTNTSVTAVTFVTEVINSQRYRHPEDDEEAILKRFAEGEVVLRNGTALTPESILTEGTDVFFYRRPAPERPVPYEIETVFEDDDILVVNKPPFLATMPRAAHITETATVRLRRATGNEELTPAHRLDRMTSGLLLFTKRRELRGPYQELFARREVHKLYEAIAEFRQFDTPALWEHHIHKEHGINEAQIISGTPNSVTHLLSVEKVDTARFSDYNVETPLARYTLEPVTGKTHQLRIQMKVAGVPILGDPIYHTRAPYRAISFLKPMLLRSIELSFTDPLSGMARRFKTTRF